MITMKQALDLFADYKLDKMGCVFISTPFLPTELAVHYKKFGPLAQLAEQMTLD